MSKAKTAKLFRNGRSQAVRLPREFRFEGDEVRIRQVGGGALLEPRITAAASDFQNAGVGRDQVAVISRQERTVESSKPIRLGRRRIVELANAIEVGTY